MVKDTEVIDPVNFPRIAYEAYGDRAGWKNYRGDAMPAWADLPPPIRLCWEAATTKIIDLCEEKD
jgi:hypothetical protein